MTIFRTAKDVALPVMNLLKLKSTPIMQQLHLEQRLLRTSTENWCIINQGINPPAIVMGTSGNPSELIEIESVLREGIPVIRRFSGGGTVIVDEGTIFVTLICGKDAVPDLQPYPRSIMSWTGELYGKAFEGTADFRLRENDYVFGDLKFGGNAQSITKDRWLHHTSFLWDYDVRNMTYLRMPRRRPEYRRARNHKEFLCAMKNYLPTRSTFIAKTIAALETHFSMRQAPSDIENSHRNTEFPNSAVLLTKLELEEALEFQRQELEPLLQQS
ncbi:hypothetical protein H6P81_011325 [Aristolochia fimbriata]|uniref:BPL/LPL catalytic domain-containing protein n=1 Tax=Aristolochia fimbriata TaxID=158543 RepID=A0AAV7ETE5_ARIFI|nr:hypothetical protein H6P81_011325 [Aristolochia fimbriata]